MNQLSSNKPIQCEIDWNKKWTQQRIFFYLFLNIYDELLFLLLLCWLIFWHCVFLSVYRNCMAHDILYLCARLRTDQAISKFITYYTKILAINVWKINKIYTICIISKIYIFSNCILNITKRNIYNRYNWKLERRENM